MRKNQILTTPTRPLAIDGRKNVSALLEKMEGISFQGRNLGTAHSVWRKMLRDRVMIMMGLSGAMELHRCYGAARPDSKKPADFRARPVRASRPRTGR